jgi:protein-disulfide isomerase
MRALGLLLFFTLCVTSINYGYAANITVPEHHSKIKEKERKAKLPEQHPAVHISGKEVIPGSAKKRTIPRTVDTLPEKLQTERAKSAIATRRKIKVYEHNPSYGPENAPIEIVEMTDLNCLQCMAFLKKLDEVVEQDKYKDKVRFTHIHLPVDLYNSTNPAAFYGKIAQKQGYFWEYRKQLFAIDEIKDNTFINKLVSVGGNAVQIRKLVRFNARKFYKELDADALYAKSIGETKPPTVFINGIKVGHNIKIDEISALLDYELDMIE